jgi:asparagine synthase (glutamine-hydrolysing)
MCGITGFVNTDGEPASPIILQRMMDMIAHRGPDGEGLYTQGPVGLGHRRLSIIDLSPAGHQPMMSADGRLIIIYNGETYNFQELRLELETRGHQFRSRTDTEVVLTAYMEWGEKALDRLNGMFAFAVWDRLRKELFLARDRYGIKPLYYTQQGNAFLFGSEVKSFLPHPSFQTLLDKEALFEYFTFQNLFSQRTLFMDVRLLSAGSYLRVPLGIKEPGNPVCYWDYSFAELERVKDEQAYLEELDRLLRQAVQRQLVSDVDVGAYLSGGMDSGTITAIAAMQIPNLKSFTCGFDLHSASGIEMAFDERQKAELMSYRFKTEHYEVVLKAGDMERILPALTWHLEDLRVGQSYPNYYVAQLTSKFVKVALSGTGGDEMFGGYP